MNERGQAAGIDPQSSAEMFRLIAGFRCSRAIYIAAKLGLADLLKDGPKGSDELAKATGSHGPSLYRIMRALASVGIFAEDDQGRFTLTPIAATLQSHDPGSLRAWAILVLGEEHYLAWGDLMNSMRTGETAFEHVFGMGTFQYAAQHPEHAKIFDEAMANLIGVYNTAVLASYSFSTFDTIVDVGGGDGSFIVAILQANPKLKGVLFDLPHVTEKAKQRIATAGIQGRCEVVAGDAFASVPSGGDAYLLSRVINAFDNQRAVAVLKNCRRAMTDKSRLILVERVIPNQVERSIAAQGPVFSDLNMMVVSGGRERTAAEHRDVLETAGFTLKKIIPTQSEVSVIEGEPT